MNKNDSKGSVIWITGLSGAGKSTLAKDIYKKLSPKKSNLILLDGDELRDVFSPLTNGKNHSRSSRLALAYAYSNLCCMLQKQNFEIIIATISMFKEIHELNRIQLNNYFEVFLKTPIEELKRRDSKSIYSKYESLEIKNVAGIDLKVDEPKNSDLIIEFPSKLTIEELSDKVISLTMQ